MVSVTSAIYATMYAISTSLLYPVILALILLVVYSLMELGAFIVESAKRRRNFEDLRKLKGFNFEKIIENLEKMQTTRLLRMFILDLKKLNPGDEDLEKLLEEFELKVAKELEIPRILTRIGPMLGLMGTLIPLGPAMIALSQGNIHELATNLITAFATTVLGLIVGGIGYTVFMVRKRWYLEDLSDMEYIIKIWRCRNEKKAD
ncbi:MAG: MotA/TolQ/ExbB proton channel family protein [Archaeoglobaceae archaeon]|uniref:MotA/TolQ/ExbB proton channel family protein n=1 Tax=Archaeoglobus fulgidus TaxID=2234 RepID=A0A7J3M096_ARCFL